MPDPTLRDVPGFKYRITKQGFRVIELDPWADPAKDQAWLDQARRSMPDENTFKREYLRDWTTGKGAAFYPEFARIKDSVIRPAPGLLDGPILRGWDFGQRRPACVWAQWDPVNKRLWFLREVMPDNVSTYAHRDLVMYLSGQKLYTEINTAAKSWVERMEADERVPPVPWFKAASGVRPRTFIDFSGPEALVVQANVEDDNPLRCAAQILAADGVHLRVWTGRVKSRTDVLRRLMEPRQDGTYGAYYDPACAMLIEGLMGGVSYRQGTKLEPMPEEPQKNGTHEHLHDAAGYLAVNVVDLNDRELPDPNTVIGFRGRDPYLYRDYMRDTSSRVDWREGRR